MSTSSELHVYTTKYLFRKVKDIIRELKGARPEINKVFDAPAGSGALSKFLKEELNLDVTAADIDASKWKYAGAQFQSLDLNERLPFEDNSFDLVVCLEGLKHFGFVNFTLSEFSRILKPGGILVVTIPNDLSLQTRLRYLFTGFVDVDWKGPIDPHSDNEREFLHPKSILSWPYLYYFLSTARFKYLDSYTDRVRGWSVLLTVLFYPIIFLATARACSTDQELRRELRNLKWLAGRHNIIVSKKRSVRQNYLNAITVNLFSITDILNSVHVEAML